MARQSRADYMSAQRLLDALATLASGENPDETTYILPTEQAAVTSATNGATGAMAAATTAQLMVAANPTRHRILLRNNDATLNLTVGFSAAVTTANGFRVPFTPAGTTPADPLILYTQAAIYVICGSGNPIINWLEEYDT